MLPLRARLDVGAMAMKKYSTFPKALTLLELNDQCLMFYLRYWLARGGYPLQRCSRCIRQPTGLMFTKGLGGARGVMVIVIGNRHGNTSSNPGRD